MPSHIAQNVNFRTAEDSKLIEIALELQELRKNAQVDRKLKRKLAIFKNRIFNVLKISGAIITEIISGEISDEVVHRIFSAKIRTTIISVIIGRTTAVITKVITTTTIDRDVKNEFVTRVENQDT